LKQLYPVGVSVEELEDASGGGRDGLSSDYLVAELKEDAQHAYDLREEGLGAEVTRELERRVILSVLDRKWREHLYEMDYLRDGIGLRAMAQRDPLVEYQREGYDLFNAMMEAIKEESVGYLFNVEVQVAEPGTEGEQEGEDDFLDDLAESPAGDEPALATSPQIRAKGLGPSRPQRMEYSAPDETGGVQHGAIVDEGGELLEVDPDASRAERRRAARQGRKRKR
jgi:preprotein translocase subunit SecA